MPLTGFGVGIGLVTLGIGSDDPAVNRFTALPGFITWAVLVGALVSVWALFSLACLPAFLKIWSTLGKRRRLPVAIFAGVSIIYVTAQVTVPLVSPPFFAPLPGYKWRLGVLTALGIAAAFPPYVGTWSVLFGMKKPAERLHALQRRRYEATRSLMDDPATLPESSPEVALESKELPRWSPEHAWLADYLIKSRGHLQLFLLAGAVIIGSTTLSMGALRNALIAWDPSYEALIPAEHVLLYGLMLVFFLAVMYFPAYMANQQGARELLNVIRPLPVDGVPEAAWVEERERMKTMLGLGTHPLENIRSGVAVAAPLIMSYISTLLPAAGG